MKSKFFLVLLFFLFCNLSYSQIQDSTTVNKTRLKTVLIGQGVAYTGVLVGLSQLWYKNEDQSSFHTFDDSQEWRYVDKAGHFYTSFHLTRINTALYRWAGLSDKKAVLYGSLAGFLFMTPIEIMDGYSSAYGFSWSDMAVNTLGVVSYSIQELIWNDVYIMPKFSYHNTGYAAERPNVLGSTQNERLIKDYNGQTYWLSFDLYSLMFKETKFPKWLNFTIGYGAEGMVSANEESNNALGYQSYSQYYFSLDLDVSHWKSKSKTVNTLLFLASSIRIIPFPTLMYDKENKWQLKPLYY